MNQFEKKREGYQYLLELKGLYKYTLSKSRNKRKVTISECNNLGKVAGTCSNKYR